MVLVTLETGECVEVSAADAVKRSPTDLICLSPEGRELMRFPLQEVLTFTTDQQVAKVLEDEHCDDEPDRV